jgi:hypothetical protein
MRKLALVAVFAVACGLPTAHAQTLALTYKNGDTYKYALHSTANETVDASVMSVPIKLDLTALETVTVKSVDATGKAGLSIDLTDVVMKTSTGEEINATTATTLPTISMTVAADGRVLAVNGSSFGDSPLTLFSGGGGFISAVLPDKPVKPNDTWSKDFDQANTLGTGGVHVTAKSKYLRDESLKGIKAAVVETKTSGTIDITIDMSKVIAGAPASTPSIPAGLFQSLAMKGTLTSTVTSWIDPSGRRVMKSHKAGTTNATMTFIGAGSSLPGLTGPITIKGDDTTDLSPV